MTIVEKRFTPTWPIVAQENLQKNPESNSLHGKRVINTLDWNSNIVKFCLKQLNSTINIGRDMNENRSCTKHLQIR